MQPENRTMNTPEFGLKAGFLLRRMRELAADAHTHPGELERVRAEAQALQESWRALMAELNPDAAKRPASEQDDHSKSFRL
jgi:hypothetical protein